MPAGKTGSGTGHDAACPPRKKAPRGGGAARRRRDVVIRPVTPSRWEDLENLFGPKGACAGCWCMYWRRKRSDFEDGKGAGNRRALRKLVREGGRPGLLAYVGSEVAGWCCVGPRDAFPVLDRSRVLARLDDRPVWSVVCLYVAPPYRRRGLTVKLLRASVEEARSRGARIVEGYPIDPPTGDYPAAFSYTGLLSGFRQAGFREVARRSKTRPIVRKVLRPVRRKAAAGSR
jgi:GNAT superfamily N-acetyltransferase